MMHNEIVVDRVNATATTWLGLTVGCARCHDHKFDPIKQKDFYSFYAFFNTIAERGIDGATGNAEPVLLLPTAEQKKKLHYLEQEITHTLKELPQREVVALLNQWRQSAAATIPELSAQGLKAHYEFENNLADSSARHQEAKLNSGELRYEDGQVGREIVLRPDHRVSFSQTGDFDRDRPFALSVWVRNDIKLIEGAGTGLFEKRDPSQQWRGYTVSLEDTAFSTPIGSGAFARGFRVVIRLSSRWPEDALEIRTTERVMHESEMQHLVVNYDGSGRAGGFTINVDGKRAQVETIRDHLLGNISTSAELTTGTDDTGGGFRGELDDLRIYDHTLSAAQITTLQKDIPARAALGELANKAITEIASLKPEQPPAELEIGMLPRAKSPEQQAADNAAKRQRELQQRLSDYYLSVVAPSTYRSAYLRLIELREQKKTLLESLDRTLVMAELKKPRATFLLGRGQYNNPKQLVSADVPAFLLPLSPELRNGGVVNRLTLAKWLLDPANPLTARVEVNRYWQNYFGTGLVKTTEDFGSQGERPSHPELLDWLATEFIRVGWDIKAMQRLIVLSATYRQSSRLTPALLARDPENRLLARGPRVRLAGEEIRDNALAVSGLLTDKTGGRSVYPYQPTGVWDEVAFGMGETGQVYRQSTGPDLYRRSLYTIWKRVAPPPTLMAFDAPDRMACAARRTLTNTPLQALALLNEPTYLEASRALAQTTLLEAKDTDTSRLSFLFKRVMLREPTVGETATLLRLQQQQLEHYRQDAEEAVSLLKIGSSKASSRLDPAELAAWATVASAVLNMDEAITKQ